MTIEDPSASCEEKLRAGAMVLISIRNWRGGVVAEREKNNRTKTLLKKRGWGTRAGDTRALKLLELFKDFEPKP